MKRPLCQWDTETQWQSRQISGFQIDQFERDHNRRGRRFFLPDGGEAQRLSGRFAVGIARADFSGVSLMWRQTGKRKVMQFRWRAGLTGCQFAGGIPDFDLNSGDLRCDEVQLGAGSYWRGL